MKKVFFPAGLYSSRGFKRRALLALWLFILSLQLCIAGLVLGAGRPKKAEAPGFVPGQEVRVDVDDKDIGNDHFMVYVPSDYTDEQDWPVIFCFHGMDGQPTTWPFKETTRGKGFIIVGMGYVEGGKGKMTRGQYVNYIKRERKSILRVKKHVSNHLKIDNNRLFVAGYSKGGWHSSAILESSAKVWAGAIIFAAGRSPHANVLPSNKNALRNKPIYIGAGETDTNLAAAKKANTHYRRWGANVAFEEFKGRGHGFEPSESAILYNWLLFHSATDEVKSKWAEKRRNIAIIPRKGMGELRFGMTISQAREVLGPAERISGVMHEYLSSGFAIDMGGKNETFFAISCGDKINPRSVLARVCKLRTAEGIGMGSKEEEIIAAYGEASSRRTLTQSEGPKLAILNYHRIRASFRLRNNKVFYMSFEKLL
jgi:poly(3-hydroxybutyrate) depolymerase